MLQLAMIVIGFTLMIQGALPLTSNHHLSERGRSLLGTVLILGALASLLLDALSDVVALGIVLLVTLGVLIFSRDPEDTSGLKTLDAAHLESD